MTVLPSIFSICIMKLNCIKVFQNKREFCVFEKTRFEIPPLSSTKYCATPASFSAFSASSSEHSSMTFERATDLIIIPIQKLPHRILPYFGVTVKISLQLEVLHFRQILFLILLISYPFSVRCLW